MNSTGKVLGFDGEYLAPSNPYFGPFRPEMRFTIPTAYTSLVIMNGSPELTDNIELVNTWYTSGGVLPVLAAVTASAFTIPIGAYTLTTLTAAINASLVGGFLARLEIDPTDSLRQVIRFYHEVVGPSGTVSTAVTVIMNYEVDYDQLCVGAIPTKWDHQRWLSAIFNTGGKMVLDATPVRNESPYMVSATDLSPMQLNTGELKLYIGPSMAPGSEEVFEYVLNGYFSIDTLITELNRQTLVIVQTLFPADPVSQKAWEIQFTYSTSTFLLTIYGDRDVVGGTAGVTSKAIRIVSDFPDTDYSLRMYKMLGFSTTQVFVDTEAVSSPSLSYSAITCTGLLPVSITEIEYCYILCNLVEGKDNVYTTSGGNINSILARLQIPANPGSYTMSAGGFIPIQVIGSQDKVANIGVQFVVVDRYGAELQGVSNWSLCVRITY